MKITFLQEGTYFQTKKTHQKLPSATITLAASPSPAGEDSA